MQETTICTAVNYKTDGDDNCELLVENKQTAVAISTYSSWSYHIRPSCAGKWLAQLLKQRIKKLKSFMVEFHIYYSQKLVS